MTPRARISFAGALLIALPLGAQATSADSLAFVRAQRLVADGDAARGRALVDSVLAAIPPTAPRYAEGLYWRASIALAALDAERDYRRIAVEYSLSPRVPDALTRLAQLELARGDRVLAARHLERLLREYPPAPARATAWYWLARIGFEDSDVARACIALDSARMLAPAASAELVTQIRYESARCLTSAAARSAPAPAAAAKAGATAAALAVAYSVQVGAFPTRAAADKLRGTLATQGFEARVVPGAQAFRVRVGRYATRAAAERAAARMKSTHGDAWIVEAEPAP